MFWKRQEKSSQARGTVTKGPVAKTVKSFSKSIGVDLSFRDAWIFSPQLGDRSDMADLLNEVGLPLRAKGNSIQLLTNKESARRLSNTTDEKEIQVKSLLRKLNIGLTHCDEDDPHGKLNELRTLQVGAMEGFLTKYQDTDARRLAVFDLHRFSKDALLGG